MKKNSHLALSLDKLPSLLVQDLLPYDSISDLRKHIVDLEKESCNIQKIANIIFESDSSEINVDQASCKIENYLAKTIVELRAIQELLDEANKNCRFIESFRSDEFLNSLRKIATFIKNLNEANELREEIEDLERIYRNISKIKRDVDLERFEKNELIIRALAFLNMYILNFIGSLDTVKQLLMSQK